MLNKHLTTIYIVRHGQSVNNISEHILHKTHVKFGHGNSPLTETGKQQAKKLAETLRNIQFSKIITSSYIRAKQTGEIIGETLGLELQIFDKLHERLYGEQYYTLPKPERLNLQNKVFSLKNENEKLDYKFFPDGESANDALKRMLESIKYIDSHFKGQTIIAVTHGGLMRFLLMYLKYATYNQLPAGSIENCGYIVIETDGKNITLKRTVGINKKSKSNEE